MVCPTNEMNKNYNIFYYKNLVKRILLFTNKVTKQIIHKKKKNYSDIYTENVIS